MNINLTVSNFKISDISLSLYPGEVHMIMGDNGSGKSMLMELISGIQQPDSGAIYFEGQMVKPKTLPPRRCFFSNNIPLRRERMLPEGFLYHRTKF